jgi:endonuclease/exonuclease/phosphatase (EEP) superfamily protein YafD
VERNGYRRWKAEFDTLVRLAPTLRGPVVLAGDLNTTRFRPQFRALLGTGLRDVHDMLGKGLTSSFKLAARGLLASPGALVRLDHALVSSGVRPVRAEDLEAGGSDHLPFRVTLAVRQRRRSPKRV